MEKNKKKKNQTKFSTVVDNNSSFSLFEVTIIILISVIFGIIIGYSITYSNSNLRRVRSDTYLGEVVSTYNNIVDNYYGNLDERTLSESAIRGMVSSLDDPYSAFFDESSTDSFNESVDGEYIGIGVTVEYQEDYNRVFSVLENSPAEKAGVQVGDKIVSVDEQDCFGLLPEEIYQMVDGKAGTSLSMTVLREEETISFELKRQVIEIQNVESRVISSDGEKIGYIKIKLFSSNSYKQFENAIQKLEKKKIQSLIIDVRDNPGGHLQQAREVLSLFFDKDTVLYQIEKNGTKKKVYSINNDSRKYPVVILINGETASSAEVLAACFSENYKKATLVGSNSFGKGNVQKSVSLSNGTSIKFTIESWLTPSGKSINEKGIAPDVYVEQDPVYYVEYKEEYDQQLSEAILLLK